MWWQKWPGSGCLSPFLFASKIVCIIYSTSVCFIQFCGRLQSSLNGLPFLFTQWEKRCIYSNCSGWVGRLCRCKCKLLWLGAAEEGTFSTLCLAASTPKLVSSHSEILEVVLVRVANSFWVAWAEFPLAELLSSFTVSTLHSAWDIVFFLINLFILCRVWTSSQYPVWRVYSSGQASNLSLPFFPFLLGMGVWITFAFFKWGISVFELKCLRTASITSLVSQNLPFWDPKVLIAFTFVCLILLTKLTYAATSDSQLFYPVFAFHYNSG